VEAEGRIDSSRAKSKGIRRALSLRVRGAKVNSQKRDRSKAIRGGLISKIRQRTGSPRKGGKLGGVFIRENRIHQLRLGHGSGLIANGHRGKDCEKRGYSRNEGPRLFEAAKWPGWRKKHSRGGGGRYEGLRREKTKKQDH